MSELNFGRAKITSNKRRKRNGVDPSVRAKNSGGSLKCSSRSGRDCRGDIGLADQIGSEFLQRGIGI